MTLTSACWRRLWHDKDAAGHGDVVKHLNLCCDASLASSSMAETLGLAHSKPDCYRCTILRCWALSWSRTSKRSRRSHRFAAFDDPFEWRMFRDHLLYQLRVESHHLHYARMKICFSIVKTFLIKNGNLSDTNKSSRAQNFPPAGKAHLSLSKYSLLHPRCCKWECRVDQANRWISCCSPNFVPELSRCSTATATPIHPPSCHAVDVQLPGNSEEKFYF